MFFKIKQHLLKKDIECLEVKLAGKKAKYAFISKICDFNNAVSYSTLDDLGVLVQEIAEIETSLQNLKNRLTTT